MLRPKWLEYAIYEDRGGYPVLIGFKKDTPPEMIEQFKKDQKDIEKAQKEGIIL